MVVALRLLKIKVTSNMPCMPTDFHFISTVGIAPAIASFNDPSRHINFPIVMNVHLLMIISIHFSCLPPRPLPDPYAASTMLLHDVRYPTLVSTFLDL